MLKQPLSLKPPFALVGSSLFVLAACMLWISVAISALTVTWDPCSLFSGFALLQLFAYLAFHQYSGTFRHDSKSAFITSLFLFVVGGMAWLAVAITLIEMPVEGVRIPWLSLLTPLFGFGVVCGAFAWINLSWSRRIERSLPADEQSADWTRFSIRELMAAVAAIACVIALTTFIVRSAPPRHAENVSRDKAPFGLPAEASGISYCQGIRGTIAYEFTIDEKGFVKWVESGIGSIESEAANVTVQPIKAPYTIRRYCNLAPGLTGQDSITVVNGLFYNWSKEDRGVHAAFDRTTNRAYYYAHFH